MAKDSDEDYRNRRRFQRVYFEKTSPEDQRIPGVEAVWFNKQRVAVYDISYSGAALQQPEGDQLTVCRSYMVKFDFDKSQPCEIEAEVMWINKNVVGVAFGEMNSQARMVFNKFIDDKLIGANLNIVDKELYGPNLDCDYWLRGPKETNVMIWLEDQKVKKVVVELVDEEPFIFSGGEIVSGAFLLKRSLDILSQLVVRYDFMSGVLTQMREKG